MKTEIFVNDEYIEVDVDYTITGKYVPERRYMSNGDPGYPAEYPELEITHVIGPDNTDYITFPLDWTRLDELCWEYADGSND